MTKRHNKFCTFKRTNICICENIESALAIQQKKHEDDLYELRMTSHMAAAKDYRAEIIKAFTNLIDGNFTIEETHNCNCSRWDY
jgi:hypothetical protein